MSKKHTAFRDSRTGKIADSASANGRSQKRATPAGQFTLGAPAIAKLNAIEGLVQSGPSRKMFAEFDRSGASAEERRHAIVAKHSRKA